MLYFSHPIQICIDEGGKQMKNKLVALMIVLIMVLPVLSACQSAAPATTANPTAAATESAVAATATPAATAATDPGIEPYGKYAKEVTVTLGCVLSDNIKAYDNAPNGITLTNNAFNDYLKNTYNMVVKYAWLAPSDSYDQKVSLVIASGDLPDVMTVKKQEQVIQMQDAGMLADMTDSYTTTAADYIKAFYDNYGDRKFTTATFGGRLMAIPDLTPGYQHSFTWLRKDWLDKLGLPAPKTADDLIKIAQAFVDNKMGGDGTIGFALNKDVAGYYNSYANMDPMFASFHSFPRQWIKDASGNYYYGTVAPETKTALAKITDMYAKGLIDKGFAARTMDDVNALLLSGKCGIYFGPWWQPDWPLGAAISNDPKCDWEPYLAPVDSNGDFNAIQQNPHVEWLVVNAKYAHPEVAWKLANLAFDRDSDTTKNTIKNSPDYFNNKLQYPYYVPDMIQWSDAIPREYKVLQAAIDAKSPAGLAPEPLKFYNDMQKWLVDKDPTMWHVYGCRIVGSAAASLPTKFADNVYPATTPTMETKWANLKTLEDQTLLKIIMGEEPIDSFDQFVKDWNSQGGTEIVAEVNKQLKGN